MHLTNLHLNLRRTSTSRKTRIGWLNSMSRRIEKLLNYHLMFCVLSLHLTLKPSNEERRGCEPRNRGKEGRNGKEGRRKEKLDATNGH